MIWLSLLLVGSLIGQFYPDSWRLWVRGVAGKARDLIAGVGKKAPAPAARPVQKEEDSSPVAGDVSNEGTRKPIDWLKLAGQIWSFIWFWRYWIMAALIAWFAWGLLRPVVSFVTCPFGLGPFCDSKSDDAALENERLNTRVAQLEASVGALSGQLAENTSNDRRRVDRVIAQANEGITDAVEAGDPDQLYSQYESHYGSVWNDLASGEPNPPPRRSAPVRGPDASPV